MAPDADVVVIGAGVAGAATARALARHPGTIVLLEQFEVGHTRGSSHGTSRIFRLNYPDERFVRMAQAADAAWREVEAECDEPLVDRIGALDLGPAAEPTSRALAACGVPYESLSGSEVSARWPLRVAGHEHAIYQRGGGTMHAGRAHAALIDAATSAGVVLRERTRARSLALDRGSVRIELDRGELSARAVVVTAGAWAASLLEDVNIQLAVVPTRETVLYVDLPGADAIPPVIDYARRPTSANGGISRVGQAAYALAAPGVGLKAGLHHSGPVTDPDDDPLPDEQVASWVSTWVEERYEMAGSRVGLETCLYTNTADEGFVLERHGRVIVGSACSGHGFKFAPVVGRTLAALAREAAS